MVNVPKLDQGTIDRFYAAAVAGLRALEAQHPTDRRFGPNADATWKAFKGELNEGDRVDLLLRDAALQHPAAFGPRSIFLLDGLAEDEPFGPEWQGPEPSMALRLLRDSTDSARSFKLGDALAVAAKAWGVSPKPLREGAAGDIQAATRFWLSGPGAVVSLAGYFEGRRELDLADQAILVTDQPAERQMFGLAVALLQSTRPARLVTSDQARTSQLPNRAFVSDDLPPEAKAALTGLPGR